MKIEHKIIREKDYLQPIVLGSLWIIVCLALSSGAWWLLKTAVASLIIASIFASLAFCYGLYTGRDFFKPEMREEVIHVIKKSKSTNMKGGNDNNDKK